MVNKTEIKAKEWLIKVKKYNAKDIIKNARGTPDFICSDGKRYEVKFFNGGQIMFTTNQIKSMKDDDIVIVFDKDGYIGEFEWADREAFFIKIRYWKANTDPKVVVTPETKKALNAIGAFEDTYDSIIQKLLKFFNSKNKSLSTKKAKL